MARVGVMRLVILTSRRSVVAVLTVAATVAGCDGRPTPTAPTLTKATLTASGAVPGSLGAVELVGTRPIDRLAALSAPDGATLKATAPAALSPIAGAQADDLVPLLTVSNAQGRFAAARFRYRFQVYVLRVGGGVALIDTGAVDEGSGITSYIVGLQLKKGTEYRWRARAKLDGAHGPWSLLTTFRTPTFISLTPPTPLSPIDGTTAASLRPNLRVLNSAISGGAGPVAYEYHLGDEGPAFPNPVVLMASPSSTGMTSTQFEDALAAGSQYWWRVRVTDGTETSDWSVTATFRTLSVPTPASQPPPPD